MLNADAAQLLAHHPRQRTAAGFFYVAQRKALRVALVAGPERGHDGYAATFCRPDEIDLAGHEVDAIDDEVVVCKEILAVLGVVAADDGLNVRIGVYVLKAQFDDVGLWHADGRGQRTKLAVYVAQSDRVLVDKRKMPDAASRERLGAP